MEARDAEAAAAAVKGSATPQSAAPDSQEDAPSKPSTPVYSFDQLLYLQDFPKTALDVQALMDLQFDKLHGVFLIEEAFSREIEDEEDDDTDGKPVDLSDEAAGEFEVPHAPLPTPVEGEEPIPEKLKCKMMERVRVIENCVAINRILKT